MRKISIYKSSEAIEKMIGNQDRITLRAAVEADAAGLIELTRQLGYEVCVEDMTARLRRIIHDPDSIVMVALNSDTVIGWISAASRVSIESGIFAEITGLVVDSACRKTGIGRRLVRETEAWAAKKGDTTIRVRTNLKRVDAPRFYTSIGFGETKRQSVFEKKI